MRERDELGPYRIVRRIAVGGMAEIYLARHRGIEGLERTVVVKQILEKHEKNEEFVTMFLDEARLMAALSHPNIAQVLDLARDAGTHYLVMEHVRGPTLQAMLANAQRAGKAPLPARAALGIALAIAQALHYVHERRDELGRPLGIVHRDLNPSNVLVSYDGAVKIIDFGIAKAATKVYETRTGVIKGTYGYIAPEALTGSAQVDRRADVFALGILLYEMLVGKHPFDASDEPNLLDRILEARYKRPREVRPELPAALDRVIARCLTPHPEGRPESMQQLIEELAAHMAASGLVPTELDLAALARELVPDEEGPAPLRRPTSVEPRPVFPREGPAKDGGTRKVGTPSPPSPAIAADAGETEGDPTHRALPSVADLPPPEPSTRKIAAPLVDDPGPPTMPRAAAAVEAPWPPDDEGATIPAASRPRPVETTMKLRPSAPASRSIHPLLGGIGLVVAGVAAFAAARALGGPHREPEPRVILPPVPHVIPADADAVSPVIPRALHVVSDPPGAAIALDGVDLAMRTPAVIAVDPRIPAVVIAVSLEGYAAQSREVSTSVQEARFVLAGTASDAGVAGEPEAPRRRARRGRRAR